MGQFIEGIDRHQAMLLPECLDDYVSEDSAVRTVDAFVEMLDLAGLGFKATPSATGRPGYHPGVTVAARDAMAPDRIEAIADKGYYKSEEILACEEAGIAVVVPSDFKCRRVRAIRQS